MDDDLAVRLQARHRTAIGNLAAATGCAEWQVAAAMLEARLGELARVYPGLDRAGSGGRRAAERALRRHGPSAAGGQ